MGCWSSRGCDEEMRGRCPHALNEDEKCPLSCFYAKCDRATYDAVNDPWLLLDPAVDRSAAAKEVCTTCRYFLVSGPRR